MLKRFFILPLLLLLAATAFCKEVNIYHTSDTHGFYFPREINGKLTGGFAALAALLDGDKSQYLLLDSGDWAAGTAEAKAGKGALSVQFMNKLGYNGATIGNHDFDFKDEALLANIRKAEFDIIAANVFDKKTKTYPDGIKPFKIYLAEGKKIAIIGIGLDINYNSTLLHVTNGRKELKNALKDVKKQNPDIIVLLAHMSLNAAGRATVTDPSPLNLIKGLEGINLVLGGHNHKIFEGEKVGGVVFSEPGAEIIGVSKIKLDFDDATGRLKDIKSEYIELDISQTGEDPYIKEFAEANRIKDLDIIIGRAKETIYRKLPDTSRYLDSPIGNIFADLQKEYTGADIGLHNTGGARIAIPEGPITKRMADDLYPFPNKLMVANVSGAFLRELAKISFRGDHAMFQYSGMTVKYIMNGKNKPQAVEIAVNGKPLDDKKIYSVAVNDYIGSGGAEGAMFKKIKDKKMYGDKPVAVAELFINYLKANPEGISAPPPGRIIVER